MEKGQLLYEGKAKRIYQTNEEEVLWVAYKDSATAFNGLKKEEILGKGHLNNEITSLLFEKLTQEGIENHFIKQLSSTEQLVKKVEIIPLEVVVRNVIAGSLAKRLGMDEGIVLDQAIIEFYYKDDELGDPFVADDHIRVLNIATPEELTVLRTLAAAVNQVIEPYFATLNITLVDFKLEFGKTSEGKIILADEISPDTCRLWDKNTNEKLDKDLFRRELGDITQAYQKILDKLKGDN
ncbi:MAG: phosphoribosylaminoimidazolesuccinocarboxamide synthase [Streptococcaceae bacterium]|nr:phosphoribosylaminoimidazolesuccinocarboxamide synthase [Streptococcaceae bacterium]